MILYAGEFKNNLGPDADKIMAYCLGENWKKISVQSSRDMFNKALSLNLQGDDLITESALIIRDAYYKKL